MYQLDLEKQALAPEGGHNYAWTNCYLVDAASDDQARYYLLALAEIEAAITPVNTNIRFICWRAGIGGSVPGTVEILGRNGDLAAPSGYLPMQNAARLNGRGNGRIVWYKRWRGPLRPEDVDGDVLSVAYRSLLLTSYLEPLRRHIPLMTRSGVPIERFEVWPFVAMWQRRDGTTRRIKSVLAG